MFHKFSNQFTFHNNFKPLSTLIHTNQRYLLSQIEILSNSLYEPQTMTKNGRPADHISRFFGIKLEPF